MRKQYVLQVKFGERQGMDSEDFFSTISQFLMQFRKVALENLPPFCSPRSVAGFCHQLFMMCLYIQSGCTETFYSTLCSETACVNFTSAGEHYKCRVKR